MYHQHTRRLILPVLITGTCLTILSSPASGGLCLWSGLGENTRFDNQLNWSPDPVPGFNDRAVFNVAATYQVIFPQDAQNVDLFALGGAITFRTDPESTSRHHYGLSGDVFVENGSLEIDGFDLLVSNHVLIDDGGGMTVGLDDVGFFGRGHVDVGNAVAVGAFDSGSLTIEEGGTLINAHAYIAEWPGSVATIQVNDIGSTWITGSDAILGDFGDGLLEVRDGGLVIFGSALGIAKQPGSVGNAVVEGPGSGLYVWNELEVGLDGEGRIIVTDGAELVSSDTDIGATSGEGSVMVHGSDSSWTAGDTRIGRNGIGTLTVSGGGAVETTHARIGDFDGATGSALAISPGSRWELSDALWVGRRGSGGLSVLDGALVTSIYGSIGLEAPGVGDVTVLGQGSRWEIEQSLALGGSPSVEGGTGSLAILTGGEVEVGSTMRVWSGGSVLLEGGKLTATHIDASHNGSFVFTGGTLHTEFFEGNLWNDGGTTAPGRSVGQSDLDSLAAMNPNGLTSQTRIDGWYVQTNGTLEIQLLGSAARENDLLSVAQSAHIGGNLVVRLLAGYVPDALDEFVIIEADGLYGTFDNAATTVTIDGGGRFDVIYDQTPDGTQVRLTGYEAPRSCPTDFNGDGRSGFRDLAIMLAAWGACDGCQFDFDDDGIVGVLDLNAMMGEWGNCP